MTPIAMKCTQEQWEEIKPLLKKGGLETNAMNSFYEFNYLVNNYNSDLGDIINVSRQAAQYMGRVLYEDWDINTFLEACDLPTISATPLYTIEDLANGKCAVINDGSLEELTEVLNLAFPKDNFRLNGTCLYYRTDDSHEWVGCNGTDLPTQSVTDFLKQIEVALPEKWCVKVTKENIKILSEWRGCSVFSSDGYYINNISETLLGGNWYPSYRHVPVDYQHEITTNQFKEYILKQETKEETVEYKGQLKGFPKEVVERMLQHQNAQGNKKDVTVFETSITTGAPYGGFNWYSTSEYSSFWKKVIVDKDFDTFFKKYPKNNNMVTDNRFPFKLMEEDAKKIIKIACLGWQPRLVTRWALDLLTQEFVVVEEEFYKEMRKACTTEQNALFDKIFGKDIVECPYKDCELIWVKIGIIWELRYSNGNLDEDGDAVVYCNQNKGGLTFSYKQHQKANGIELPD